VALKIQSWHIEQQIVQIFIHIQPIGLGSLLHQTVNCGTGLGNVHNIAEQPVLSTDAKKPDGIFGQIVGNRTSASSR